MAIVFNTIRILRELSMRIIRAVFAAALFALVAVPTLAHAATIQSYSFTGVCTDCTGAGIATLNLSGYIEGTPIQAGNFVSLNYSSDLISSFEITSADLSTIFGNLGPQFPGAFDLQIFRTDGADFFSSETGIWAVSIGRVAADFGANSSWSSAAVIATPLPGALPLFASGLLSLGWMILRRKRKFA
jgi:hypothetical protein